MHSRLPPPRALVRDAAARRCVLATLVLASLAPSVGGVGGIESASWVAATTGACRVETRPRFEGTTVASR